MSNNIHDLAMMICFEENLTNLNRFSGNDEQKISQFITNIERIGRMIEANDDILYYMCIAKLDGEAKRWCEHNTSLTQWENLKSALLERFTICESSSKLFEQLKERKQRPKETVTSYYDAIMQLCREYDSSMSQKMMLSWLYNGIRHSLKIQIKRQMKLLPESAQTTQAFLKIAKDEQEIQEDLFEQESTQPYFPYLVNTVSIALQPTGNNSNKVSTSAYSPPRYTIYEHKKQYIASCEASYPLKSSTNTRDLTLRQDEINQDNKLNQIMQPFESSEESLTNNDRDILNDEPMKKSILQPLILNNDTKINAVHVTDERQISTNEIELDEPHSNILLVVHEQKNLSNQLDHILGEEEQHLIQHIMPVNEKIETTSDIELSLRNITSGMSTRSALTKTQRNNIHKRANRYKFEVIHPIYSKFTITNIKTILRDMNIDWVNINIVGSTLFLGLKNETIRRHVEEQLHKDMFTREHFQQINRKRHQKRKKKKHRPD